jgi:hypothetical protein
MIVSLIYLMIPYSIYPCDEWEFVNNESGMTPKRSNRRIPLLSPCVVLRGERRQTAITGMMKNPRLVFFRSTEIFEIPSDGAARRPTCFSSSNEARVLLENQSGILSREYSLLFAKLAHNPFREIRCKLF